MSKNTGTLRYLPTGRLIEDVIQVGSNSTTLNVDFGGDNQSYTFLRKDLWEFIPDVPEWVTTLEELPRFSVVKIKPGYAPFVKTGTGWRNSLAGNIITLSDLKSGYPEGLTPEVLWVPAEGEYTIY